MKPLVLAGAFAALLAASARALSPQEQSYLRGLGIDPASPVVVAAEADGEIKTTFRLDEKTFSLKRLIAQGDVPNGVRAFITTRAFLARLKKDFAGTEIPKTYYDPMYLTKEERIFVARKIIASIRED